MYRKHHFACKPFFCRLSAFSLRTVFFYFSISHICNVWSVTYTIHIIHIRFAREKKGFFFHSLFALLGNFCKRLSEIIQIKCSVPSAFIHFGKLDVFVCTMRVKLTGKPFNTICIPQTVTDKKYILMHINCVYILVYVNETRFWSFYVKYEYSLRKS